MRLKTAFMAALLPLLLFGAPPASAQAQFAYTTNNDGATNSIGFGAFEYRARLAGATIPNGVPSIKGELFRERASLAAGQVAALAIDPCLTSPAGLVAWWPGDGSAFDGAGTNEGISQNVSYDTGKVGRAFGFNGSSSFVQIPSSPLWAFGAEEFSIELWANFAETSGARALVSCDHGDGAQNKWIFWLNGGVLQLHFGGADGYGAWIGSAPFNPATNRWYHVAVTRASGQFTFFVDGNPIGADMESHSIPDPEAPLTLGQAEGAFLFKGLLDEVSIYRRALTPSEIQSIYAAGSNGKCFPGGLAPTFVQQPRLHRPRVCVGENVALRSGAAGIPRPVYQWLANDWPLPGETNADLALTNLQFTDVAVYRVAASNSSGSVTSSPVVLTLNSDFFARPADGHYYLLAAGPRDISWTAASNAAVNAGGHLAAIESQAENDFVFGLISNNAALWNPVGDLNGPWIGAFQPEGGSDPTAGWQWVTGVPLDYAHWKPTEPSGGNEPYAHFIGSGMPPSPSSYWNNLPEAGAPGGMGVRSYIVEFETAPGLVSRWRGDGDALDSAGAHPGAVQGSVSFGPGRFGRAFQFSGGFVEIPDSPDFNFEPGASATFTAWACRTNHSLPFHIFGKRLGCFGGGYGIHYQLGIDGSFPSTPTDKWMHWALVYKGGRGYVYTNGIWAGVDWGGLGLPNHAPFRIGFSGGCGGFAGLVEDVCVYNRSLSSQEIRSLYGPLAVEELSPDQLADPGTDVALAAKVTGGQPVCYQWQFNGVSIPSATNAILALSKARASDSGFYRIMASNYCGTLTSAPIALTVRSLAPMITRQPSSQSTLPLGSATFAVSATGLEPLQYQWFFGGRNIGGAAGPILNLTNAQFSDAGPYLAVVSNDFGATTSQVAVLHVLAVSSNTSVRPLGDWPGGLEGTAIGVFVTNELAFVAADTGGLNIYSISNSNNPRLLGKCETPGYARGVAAAGNFAYVADYDAGLRVVDASDPNNPVLVGGCDTSGLAVGVAVSGQYVYIADSKDGLQIIDVSNPAHPARVGGYDTSGTAVGVATQGGYVFLADTEGGLQIIDVSDPANPARAGGYEFIAPVVAVTVSGNYAYVLVADYHLGLQVIDITRPATPTRAGEFPGTFVALAVSANYAFLMTDGPTGAMQIADLSNPNRPSNVSWLTIGGNHPGLAISGNYLYAAAWEKGLEVFNVSNPRSPVSQGTVGAFSGPQARDIAVSGNYAYVAAWDKGLKIIDVSNPEEPALAGAIETNLLAASVAVAGDYLYVMSPTKLDVFNISNPAAPARAGGIMLGNNYFYNYGIAVAGNYAYLTSDRGGLTIVDVRNPSNPATAGMYPIYNLMENKEAYARGIAVAKNYAYVAAWEKGLWVFDVRNPVRPVWLGTCDTPGLARGVAVSGNFAYVADSEAGLQVIDVSQPTKPILVGRFDTTGSALAIAVVGNYGYVADDIAGVQVLDLSNPAHPARTGGYDTDGYAKAIATAGDFAYVADGYGGLKVFALEYSAPRNDHLTNAVFLSGNSGSIAGDFFVASLEPGEVSLYPSKPSGSVWFRWKPALAEYATFEAQGSSLGVILAVFEAQGEAGDFSALRLVAWNDNSTDAAKSASVWANPSNEYYVAILADQATGDYALRWNQAIKLLDWNSAWKYVDTGADLGVNWRSNDYRDEEVFWKGPSPGLFGFEPDTPLVYASYGGINTPLARYSIYTNSEIITYYFRTTFYWSGDDSPTNCYLAASNVADDGVLVYLNGTPLYSLRVPANATAGTSAIPLPASYEGLNEVLTPLPANTLRSGLNLIAAELHQGNGSDAVFGMALSAASYHPLAIEAQSGNQIASPGTNVALWVTASGSFPWCQWYKIEPEGTTNLIAQGANKTVLTFVNAGWEDAGTYYVVITNPVSHVTSSAMELRMAGTPPPLDQPITLLFWDASWKYADTGADLGTLWRTVAYDDNIPLWQGPSSGLFGYEPDTPEVYAFYGGFATPLSQYVTYPGGNNTYSVTNYYFRTTFNWSGGSPTNYYLVASNVVDDGVIVYLNGMPLYALRVASNATATTLATGQPSTEGVSEVVDLLPATYLSSGANLLAAELHQQSAASLDAAFGITLMAVPYVPITIKTNPVARSLSAGTSVTLSVSATGSFPYYRWFQITTNASGANVTNLVASGATNAALIFPSATVFNAGVYYVVVTNNISQAQSATAELSVKMDPLVITRQPRSLDAMIYERQSFSVEVSGSLPAGRSNFRWYKITEVAIATNVIDGVTQISYSYTTNAASSVSTNEYWFTVSSGSGSGYFVVITNDISVITSQVARLRIVSDIVGPILVSALVEKQSHDVVKITFSEQLLTVNDPYNSGYPYSGWNILNYRVVFLDNRGPQYCTNQVPTYAITNASYRNVYLQMATPWNRNTNYMVIVDNVADRTGSNSIAPNSWIPLSFEEVTDAVTWAGRWRYASTIGVFDPDSWIDIIRPDDPIAWTKFDYDDTARPPFYLWTEDDGAFGANLGNYYATLPYTVLKTFLPEGAISHYFRRKFYVEFGAQKISNLTGSVNALIDDGAVFYLNGRELRRVNMPSGLITWRTFSTGSLNSPTFTGNLFLNVDGIVTNGENIFAVEVHQAGQPDPDQDVYFDASLTLSWERTPEAPDESNNDVNLFAVQDITNQTVRLYWTNQLHNFSLVTTDDLKDPSWTQVKSASNNMVLPMTNRMQFFRLRQFK